MGPLRAALRDEYQTAHRTKVPPKPADVLIGIHIRALRFLRALGPNASSVVKAPNLREKNAQAWSGSTRGALRALNWPKGTTYFQRYRHYVSKIGSGEHR